ncbi:restriction endonuclease subunit S [Nostoc sp. 'Lobaria pulmonaria (5183) cyanobiont']|uniref:restriction endonuclease subunit S n=1 Tax=Nostoc sp. 'Lobaria pulmonaria (5183) cyanobiont' TaxID=1618022 RepID=UPI001F3F8491|nr:restriction endonuclease subunit S [Nostoc sp. 'Lobaria pulmonaria (5183) cyanobiont']
MQVPPHWRIVKLGDIAQLKNGINFNKEQKGSGTLTVDVLNMYCESSFISMNKLYRVDIKLKDDYLLKKNDILFVRSSLKQEGVGWASLFLDFTEPVTFCGFIIRARLETQEIEPIFLVNYLRRDTVRKILISKSGKVGVTNINQANLQSLPIIIPPLPEQKTIAHTLRTIQKAKETRQRELELERERKAALMQYLFTHGTRNEPRKKKGIGEIPESWQVVKLGQISQITSGGTPSRSNAKYWNGDIPWVKTGEVNYGIITDTEEKITKEGLKNSAAKIIPRGTLLMAMYGQGVTRGKVAILGIDATLNQACAAILLQQNILNDYVFYFLAGNYEKIRTLGYGANQTNLNSMIIKSITIPLPIFGEQKDIALTLKACDRKIQALEKEIALTDELFHAMLEQLMTGKISTQPLTETYV